jgi:hypothetical protein
MQRYAHRPPRVTIRRLLTLAAAALVVAGGLVGASAAASEPVPAAQTAVVGDVGATIAKTADLSKFDPGNIISDQVFFDSSTMSVSQIQDFLTSKVSSCRSGYTCLKDFRMDTSGFSSGTYCNGYAGASNESAATIIYKVATSCGINPQVLLVTLQKEQGLVTDTWPVETQYRFAMGQGCPDTAACDTQYYGFQNQVYGAARQFKIYAEGKYFTYYAPGRTWNIQYNPNAGCGSSPVYVQNKATAGLYYYTPYQPNAAALAAGYGEGDGCSAYGNRNFYQYFMDWFGSDAEHSPIGGFNLEVSRGAITIHGWTIDPDSPTTSLTVNVTVNGSSVGDVTANDYRPDVAAVYPAAGANHGILATFEVVGGDEHVCVTARNVGAGSDRSFGCVDVQVVTASPYGGATVDAIPGGIHVTGWTLDTDTTDSLAVHVYIDGAGRAYRADVSRPDVGAVFPGMGDNHGIDLSIPTTTGSHEVCVYGINVGPGMNKLLGCNTVSVGSADPVGTLESVYPEPGGFHVRGWAVDPNTSDPLTVHVYRGSVGTAIAMNETRKDVVAVYPYAAQRSGFNVHIDAPAGVANICVYGINVGWGANTGLGCRQIEVRSGQPFGGISTTVSRSSVRVQGWTIDPDTTDSLTVHTYIDGVGSVGTASVARADIAAAYPGYGAAHGIDRTYELSPGVHQICAYAINVGAGTNALLGCQQVTTTSSSPYGGTDSSAEAGAVHVRGWTIDPDTTDPLDVHVYVDGVGAAITRADVVRPDVAAAYPGSGSAHGIDVRIPLARGAHQVCSYAINVGPGANTLLGCQSVTIP